MTLTPLNVPALLRQHGLAPNRALGQNFLVDPVALQRITDAAQITKADTVLEIGPGLGSLTRHLAEAAGAVVAVELDAGLLPVLEQVLSGWGNVTLVQGDILKLDPARLVSASGYLVAANIPYYITSAVIRRLLESERKPARMVLTVQKEVAERITAKPGDLSLLALSVQVYGQPRVAVRIPAGAFYPPPKIDSAAVQIDLYPRPVIAEEDLDAFFRVAKAGFSQKRKTLRNALAGGLGWKPERAAALLQAAAIDPMRRAETVTLEEWGRLARLYREEPTNSNRM